MTSRIVGSLKQQKKQKQKQKQKQKPRSIRKTANPIAQ